MSKREILFKKGVRIKTKEKKKGLMANPFEKWFAIGWKWFAVLKNLANPFAKVICNYSKKFAFGDAILPISSPDQIIIILSRIKPYFYINLRLFWLFLMPGFSFQFTLDWTILSCVDDIIVPWILKFLTYGNW